MLNVIPIQEAYDILGTRARNELRKLAEHLELV
jgi:hypothetical protein